MIDLLEYIGLALIIFGGCLYFLSVYMIKKYEDKLRKEYTFEIVRPKIKTKGKKWLYLIMNIRGFVVVEYANY